MACQLIILASAPDAAGGDGHPAATVTLQLHERAPCDYERMLYSHASILRGSNCHKWRRGRDCGMGKGMDFVRIELDDIVSGVRTRTRS